MIRAHKAIPDVVSGYELDRLQFSVIVPIERTNLITNPSFETNTTGYTSVDGATLTRTTATQRRGVYSLQIKPGLSSVSGVYYTSSALTAGQTYAFSLDVFIRGGKKFQIRAFDGIRSLVTRPIIGKNYWERVSFIFTAVTTGVHRFYFEKNGESNNTFTDNVFTDGWQLELCEAGNYFETTYIDGDQQGFVINQFPPAYYWQGTPHASISTRNGLTRAGGRRIALSNYFKSLSVIGLGMGSIKNSSLPFGLIGGAIYQRTIPTVRRFTLVGSILGQSPTEYQLNRMALEDLFRPDTISLQQPFVLRYEFTDTGDEFNIICVYDGGLEGNVDNYYQERASISFSALSPFPQSDGQSGTQLGFADALSVNNFISRSNAGVWRNVFTIVNTPTCVAEGQDGKIYIGDSGGRVYSYDPANPSAAIVQIPGTFNAGINGIAVDANNNVFICGSFTGIGVTPFNRCAMWNAATQAWQALGSGFNGTVVNAIVISPSGVVYFTGDFTTAGGGAANRIASWNGSVFSALTTGLGNNAGQCLVFGIDGNLYVGGTFTSAGGVANTLRIAKWNISSSSWSALGTGSTGAVYALAVGIDGTIYAAGDFTSIGGITVANIAGWNGTSWFTLGSGWTGGSNGLRALAVDKEGNLYAGGNYTTAGGLIVTSKIAVWGGSNWYYIDISIPTSAISFAACIYVSDQNNLFIGYQASNSVATVAKRTTVSYGGKSNTYPILKFIGPMQLVQITNYTTQNALYFNLTLIAGEECTLNLTQGQISFVSNFRGNILSSILVNSDLSSFFLSPGDNVVAVLALGAGANAATYMMWNNMQWSISPSARH